MPHPGPASTRFDTPVLDRAVLDANTMSDADLQRELFDLYFRGASSQLDTMTAALSAADAQSWRAAAHALKGTAKTLGLLRLAAFTEEMEARSAASGPSALTQARLKAAAAHVAEAKAAAYSHLAQIKGAA